MVAASMKLEEYRELFRGFLGWKEYELKVIDYVVAAYVANFLPGDNDPPWGIVVAPPSTGKTEVLRPFSAYSRTVTRTTLTPNSFASGFRDKDTGGEDPSLLKALQGGKVLCIEDLTTLLCRKKEDVTKLIGEFRSAFDGHFELQSGSVGCVQYKDGFGFIAACTPVIDPWMMTNQQLGERCLLIRTGRDTSYRASREMARQTTNKRGADKSVFRENAKSCLVNILDDVIPSLGDTHVSRPNSMAVQIADLAHLLSRVRSAPLEIGSNGHSSKSPTEAEGPPRLVGQLNVLCDAHAVLQGRGSWDHGDVDLARRVVQDTLNPALFRILRALWRGNPENAAKPMKSDQIKTESKVALGTVDNQLSQWSFVGVTERIDDQEYALTEDAIEDIVSTGFFPIGDTDATSRQHT